MNKNKLITYHLYIFDDNNEDKKFLTDFPLIAPKGINSDFLLQAGSIIAHILYEDNYDGFLYARPDEAFSFNLELIKDGKHINPNVRVFIVGGGLGQTEFIFPDKECLSFYADSEIKRGDG